jgi:hypothetical protein
MPALFGRDSETFVSRDQREPVKFMLISATWYYPVHTPASNASATAHPPRPIRAEFVAKRPAPRSWRVVVELPSGQVPKHSGARSNDSTRQPKHAWDSAGAWVFPPPPAAVEF